jgi:hypothetical protein
MQTNDRWRWTLSRAGILFALLALPACSSDVDEERDGSAGSCEPRCSDGGFSDENLAPCLTRCAECFPAGECEDLCGFRPSCVRYAQTCAEVATCSEIDDRDGGHAACLARCDGCLARFACEGHCGSHAQCIIDSRNCCEIQGCVSGLCPP